MKRKHLKKKIGSLVLAAAMIITSFPAFSEEVQAMEVAEPSQFATKEQLKTYNTDDTDGSTDSAKLCFGNNNQEWWIAGSQEADSVTLFAASPLATKQPFDPDCDDSDATTQIKNYNNEWGCTYSGSTPTEVNANHYGGSPLRTTLKGLETSLFSTAEQGLMKDTTIYTNDTKSNSVYSTKDKLYLAYGDPTPENTQYVTVGKNGSNSDELNNGLHIDKGYWNNGVFWMRVPSQAAPFCGRAAGVKDKGMMDTLASVSINLIPAFELDLSSVLFASAAKAASSGSAETGVIANDEAMTLRLDGSGKNIGTVTYDVLSGGIEARKDADATGTVSLVV